MFSSLAAALKTAIGIMPVVKVPQQPIIAVIGATGTGKSQVSFPPGCNLRLTVWPRQLAVELARAFNGEVINCDAVQMYKGLPIITNKITRAEQKWVAHHLLDCVGLDEPTWTVGKFVPQALRTVILHSSAL